MVFGGNVAENINSQKNSPLHLTSNSALLFEAGKP